MFNVPDASRVFSHKRVDRTGVTRAIYNIKAPAVGTTREQQAMSFLQSNAAELHLTNPSSSLRADNVQDVPGGSHVRLTQMFEGVPVFRGDVVVSMNGNDEITMVINNFKSNVRIVSLSPSILQQQAIETARRHIGINGRSVGKEDTAELMIFRAEDGVDHLAYRVSMTNEEPMGDWQVFVDATNGNVLSVEDLFVNARVQGSGYVYLSDPLSAARKLYNSAGFTDNNDADSDSLTAYRTHVTLDSLTFEDGVYKLKGPYCNVTDIESPSDPPYYGATSPDGFNYTRSAQDFEAVNVYYHVTTAYKHLLDLGFPVPSLTQIRLDPHGYYGQDNSHFSPSGNWIAWGEGGVDDAEDADVIWHEYGHAIQYNIIPTWGGGECGSLGEGFGDYWAGSYSRSLTQQWSPTDMQYNWIFNWDGHNPFWLGRNLNDTRVYPFGGLEIHTAGQIWSSTLMSIWNDLGRTITDRLVIKSFYYLGSGTTGADAAQAILQADRDLYGGAHLATLVYWIGTVKHFIDPAAFIPTIVHTPPTGSQNPQGPYDICATITSQHGLNPARICVVWRFDAQTADTTCMVPTQTPDEYVATIPGMNEPGTLHYYIFATDTTGAVAFLPENAPAETYSLQISASTSDVTSHEADIPSSYALAQNFPNPFNPATAISYALPKASTVQLTIYTALGQKVCTLLDAVQPAGFHTVVWNGRNTSGASVGSGTYFYRIEARSVAGGEGIVQVRKMVLVK